MDSCLHFRCRALKVKFGSISTPGSMQQPESSDRMVARFLHRVRCLENQLKRDLFLAAGKYGISRLRALGAPEHLAGVDARPLLQDITEWIPVLLEWTRQPFDDGGWFYACGHQSAEYRRLRSSHLFSHLAGASCVSFDRSSGATYLLLAWR